MAATFERANLPTIIKYNGINYAMNPGYSAKYAQLQTFPVCKHIRVHVLSSRLKGKRDLHGNLYQPTKWIFTPLK